MKRLLLFVLALAYSLPTSTAVAADQPEAPWFQRLIVGTEVGPTGVQWGGDPTDAGYAARFNGRDIVRQQLAANSQYLVIWGKDSEFAYYNSKVAPRCPGLQGRDVIREAVEAAAPHKLPVIVYCVVQGNGYPLRQHPEWKMADPEGRPIDRICFNSGYLDHARQVLDEMMEYPIAGFHVDMLDQGFGPPYGCWCGKCRQGFQAKYGRAMPKGVTWDADWERMLEFRYETSVRFEQAVREHVRRKRPALSADFNYHGYPPFSWEVGQLPVAHARNGDFVTAETGIWGFSALGVGLTARFLAAATPGAPFQVAMSRHVRIYHDNTVRPVNDLRWELFTLLSHGAQVTVVDKTAYDGGLDPESFRRLGIAFAEARAKREHFGHPVVAEVGLYYSSRSRDWYGRQTPWKYQQAFHGAHKAVAYSHIPYGVVLDENAGPATLRQFPVVLLSNAAILLPAEIAALREYVAGGGNLIVTGHSGLFGRYGEESSTSAIEDLIGAKLVEKMPALDNHVRLSSLPEQFCRLADEIPSNWSFLVYGPAAVYRPTTAKPLGELLKPHRTLRQQKGHEGTSFPNSAGARVGPALLVNEVGKGKIVCLACAPDFAIGGEYPVPEARLLLRNVVRWLRPSPTIEIDAPMNVESVVTDDPQTRTLRVHLIGYLSPPACTPPNNRPFVIPPLVEEAPPYRAKINVHRPIRKAEAVNKTTALSVDASVVSATVNDIHEVLVIRY